MTTGAKVAALADQMRTIRKKMTAHHDELKALEAKPTLTRGDKERFDNIETSFDRLAEEYDKIRAEWSETFRAGLEDGSIEQEGVDYESEDDRHARALTADPLRNPREAETPYRGDPWRGLPIDDGIISTLMAPAELRSRAYTAIEKTPGPSDQLRAHATSLIREWDDDQGNLSRYILLTSDPAYTRAFARMMRGERDLLTDAERLAVRRVRDHQRAMSLTDAAGGFAVPFVLDPTLQITGAGSQSDIAQIARQVVTTSDSWNGVTAGQISASYDAEAAEVSDDAPTLVQPSVDIHMARVFVPASIEIIMDAPNWSQEISGMMLDALQRLEAEKFTIGSGTGEPEGLVTGLTGGTNEVSSATTDTFALADVYSLWEAVPPRHRDQAAWLGNELVYNDIRQFGSANNYSGFTVDLTEEASSRLLGRPAYRSSHMDGTMTADADNLVLVAADMQSTFVIARRIGFTIEMIPHLFATANNLPSGQRGLFGYARNGSAVVDETAGALLNVT